MTSNRAKTDTYAELGRAPQSLNTPRRALAIGAHPDDIEFGAGGTLAKWASRGCEVAMVIVTDGSKGSWDPTAEPQALVVTRAAEQDAAADALGATEVRHLGHIDGELEYNMALRREICHHVRDLQPDVVLSHDPWQRYQLHPDHRATGWATVDGVVSARDHLFFPELGLDAHRPDALLLWSADTPDHWEDISSHFDAKIAALLCHSSQGTTTMGGAEQTRDKKTAFVDRMKTWASEQGKAVGIEQAEAFKRITP